MADQLRARGLLSRVLNRSFYRFIIYFLLVLLIGIFSFLVELLLRRTDFTFAMHAAFNVLVYTLVTAAALFLLELFLHERRRTSELAVEARKADSMLSAVMQAIPDLVYIKDLEGRHIMVNRAVEEFTGKPAQDLLGRTLTELLPPDLAGLCTLSDRAPVEKGSSCRFEERFPGTHGEHVLDTIKTPLRDDRGDLTGIVCISRDITEKLKAEEERRLLQRQLLQSQKMEALGHLAGGVAHDFNNILTAIMGHTTLLRAKGANNDFLQQQTAKVLEVSERAKAIIKGLLAFSSKQKIGAKPTDINELVSASDTMLAPLLDKRICMRRDCCTVPLTVMADTVQLERVLLNLATNAQDAMPEGGELALSTDCLDIGDDFIKQYGYGAAGRYAVITVSDTGKGIPEEHIKKVFEPFFTTKEAGKGTGLGLAIAYGIIKQHRGYINVSSEPGKGATFHIYLPLVGNSCTA